MSKVVIEGNTVSVLREEIQKVSTLESFLEELSNVRPVTINALPKNCIAYARSGEEGSAYFVYLEPGMCKLNNKLTKISSSVFLPPSLLILGVGSYNTIHTMYWHFLDKRPLNGINDLKVFANPLPNVDCNNRICIGEAVTNILEGDNVQVVVDKFIDGLLSSEFNADYLDKTPQVLSAQVLSVMKDEGNKFRKEKIAELNLKINSEEDVAELKRLTFERDKLYQEIRNIGSSFSWPNYLLDYLGRWTETKLEEKATITSMTKDFLKEISLRDGIMTDDYRFLSNERNL